VTEVSGARAPQTIYVALLDEGVAVWRPVQGIELASLKFRIAVDQPYERSFERWEFEPGTLVECEPRAERRSVHSRRAPVRRRR
jgi:hypothetical protein